MTHRPRTRDFDRKPRPRVMSSHEFAVFTVSTFMSSLGSFDSGLNDQVERADDSSLALWVSVGVETALLTGVLLREPGRAFSKGVVPSDDDLRSLCFRTVPHEDLLGAVTDLYEHDPSDTSLLMADVRNTLLHVGFSTHVWFPCR